MFGTDTLEDLRSWMRTLPTAQMQYPATALEKTKYFLWQIITPIHPFVRDALTSIGVLRHNFRQDFLIGILSEGQTLREVIQHLVNNGYGIHFIAWKDTGEVVSMRFVDNFTYQHHIRIFDDGEVRAHYEYTPECHPVWHMQEVGMIDVREYFYELLGTRIIPHSPNT